MTHPLVLKSHNENFNKGKMCLTRHHIEAILAQARRTALASNSRQTTAAVNDHNETRGKSGGVSHSVCPMPCFEQPDCTKPNQLRAEGPGPCKLRCVIRPWPARL